MCRRDPTRPGHSGDSRQGRYTDTVRNGDDRTVGVVGTRERRRRSRPGRHRRRRGRRGGDPRDPYRVQGHLKSSLDPCRDLSRPLRGQENRRHRGRTRGVSEEVSGTGRKEG